jgi:hypothetical protein
MGFLFIFTLVLSSLSSAQDDVTLNSAPAVEVVNPVPKLVSEAAAQKRFYLTNTGSETKRCPTGNFIYDANSFNGGNRGITIYSEKKGALFYGPGEIFNLVNNDSTVSGINMVKGEKPKKCDTHTVSVYSESDDLITVKITTSKNCEGVETVTERSFSLRRSGATLAMEITGPNMRCIYASQDPIKIKR